MQAICSVFTPLNFCVVWAARASRVRTQPRTAQPHVRVRCSWPGQWRYYAGDIPRCFALGSGPPVASPSGAPTQRTYVPQSHCTHNPAASPNVCAYTVSPPPCLPPPRPSGRARLFRPRAGSGWANMDGNTCCMYFCTGLSMFGVVCLVRCAPLWLPFEALLALKHTDAAHPKCERPHSPSHPVSIGPARTRAPQAPQ